MDKHNAISGMASARETKKVDLSKYGVNYPDGLYIKRLSTAERGRLLEMWKAEAALEDVQKFVLTSAIADPDGRRLFDDPEADGKIIVNEWACDLVDGLTTEILKYSSIIKDDADAVESPEKN